MMTDNLGINGMLHMTQLTINGQVSYEARHEGGPVIGVATHLIDASDLIEVEGDTLRILDYTYTIVKRFPRIYICELVGESED